MIVVEMIVVIMAMLMALLSLGLAARYGRPGCAPGPLDSPPPRARTLAGLAVDTFVEGCVGETVAALLPSVLSV